MLGDIPLNYIRLEKNTGRAHAGNVGIENAKGDYIGFLDDDDEYYPEHVATLTEFLLENSNKITYADCKILHSYDDNVSEGNKKTIIYSNDFSVDELLVKNFIPFMCLLFPKAVLKEIHGLDETFDLYEDWDVLIRLSARYQFHHIRKVTAIYNLWSRDSQITEKAKYSGQTDEAFSKIFYKHRDKISHKTIQFLVRERESLKENLSEKDTIIANKNKIISEKEAVISGKEPEIRRMITEKEAEIAAKETEIRRIVAEKEAEIAVKETEIRRIVAEKEAEIAVKETEIRRIVAERDFILSEIYDSFGWQLISRYRQLKVKFFPQGSRQRRFYDLMFKSIYVIRSEGLRRFFRRAKAKLPSELPEIRASKLKSTISTDIKALSLPRYENPEVSIIIPVFNKAMYTFNCLESILENTKETSYEVIIVNNASTDNTDNVLKNIQNIVVIKNDENLGFIPACNAGAIVAKGEYLVFLNNDTKVTSGWLRQLLEVAKNSSTVGIVGPKLLYPDGRLQEAGGIVWADGTAWNYGIYDDPGKYEYNYLREVDYCSGACMLIRKSLFKKAGGFDDRYSPAYYEDTDLAFTLRKKGYKTIYQPCAEVIHFEGVTAGTDVTKGMKMYQEINREKFKEKQKDILTNEHLHPGKDVFLAKHRDHKIRKRMLFIDHYVPTYDKDAGSVRTYEYLKIFVSMGFHITFWPDNLTKMEPYTYKLQQMGVEVIYGNEKFEDYLNTYGKYFDIAFLSRPHIAIKYIHAIKAKTHMKVIYDCHDLTYLREMRRAEIESNKTAMEAALKSKKDELYLSSISDAVVVLSSFERDLLLKENPNIKVYLIPLVYPLPNLKIKQYYETKGLLYIGGFVHPPNEDAVLWFVREILPLIHKELPDVDFNILGSYLPKSIAKLSSARIKGIGYVEDVSLFFQNSRIFVAPLRFGAGAKGKIIQSMSYGLPVVTTTIGAEGLDLKDGFDALIADEPSDFANKVVELYRSGDRWKKISDNSAESMKNNFSAEIAHEKLQKMFAELGIIAGE
ncbi:MAG: glycosyltransferase [Nitrospirae bacterium]|nr:glycosyltransferase [Nitrospirota bacterium]